MRRVCAVVAVLFFASVLAFSQTMLPFPVPLPIRPERISWQLRLRR